MLHVEILPEQGLFSIYNFWVDYGTSCTGSRFTCQTLHVCITGVMKSMLTNTLNQITHMHFDVTTPKGHKITPSDEK